MVGRQRPSCSQKDCTSVAEAFYEELQKRMIFDKVQVTTTGGLGPGTEGPSVLVYPEGIMYGGVKKEDVATIFEQHLLNDQPVENLQLPKHFW